MSKHFRKRAGIELVITGLKPEHRLNKSYLKGLEDDQINILMEVAVFKFRK